MHYGAYMKEGHVNECMRDYAEIQGMVRFKRVSSMGVCRSGREAMQCVGEVNFFFC